MKKLIACAFAVAWLAMGAAAGLAWTSDAPWQTVECVPADLSPEELFDVVQPIDGFEDAISQWIVAGGDQHA